jgi:hypothetical protein
MRLLSLEVGLGCPVEAPREGCLAHEVAAGCLEDAWPTGERCVEDAWPTGALRGGCLAHEGALCGGCGNDHSLLRQRVAGQKEVLDEVLDNATRATTPGAS